MRISLRCTGMRTSSVLATIASPGVDPACRIHRENSSVYQVVEGLILMYEADKREPDKCPLAVGNVQQSTMVLIGSHCILDDTIVNVLHAMHCRSTRT